ncbi:hypothetical protein BUALT_Bualt08G0101200 [Buddleja alternifolia]|uniref:Pectinesterase inhibitor domain-containing protein n=1 Tax=Buddleja alternifolia TaxID=168488 RepID=A0AAV6X6R7_9LAMI|nr:hypothetical protein BUALT_Bualt08G0101200 [Buddleja alternifolia]
MDPSRNILISLAITLCFSLILSPANAQKPETSTTHAILPYETVNNFCVHRRLNVNIPFCFRVLKNPNIANTRPNDLTPLLQVAINSTSIYICKTITLLLDMSEDKKTKPGLKPVVEECLAAYEDIAGYITNVISDASQESTVVGLDGEVIEEYINRCTKALEKSKSSDISDRNKEAKYYVKLMIDIADNLGE